MQFASNVQDDDTPYVQSKISMARESRHEVTWLHFSYIRRCRIEQGLLTTYAYNVHLDRRSSRRFASHYGKKRSNKLSSETPAVEDPAWATQPISNRLRRILEA